MSDESVRIYEVGPRDGLQNEPETVATPAKRALVQALRFNPANPDAPRELRRLEGKASGQKAQGDQKKPGFFGKLFGKKG